MDKMDKINRDYYIDNVKGIAVISVVFIHTVFWSGVLYTPEFIRSISLIFDVPVFFVLAGFVYASTGRINSLRTSIKIIMSFVIFCFLLNILTGEFEPSYLLSTITMNSAITPSFPVVNGSYWFVPMYVVSTITSHALIESFREKSVIFIPTSILYYVYSYFSGYVLNMQFMGLSAHKVPFYVSCILSGYFLYKTKGNKAWLFVFCLSLISFLVMSIKNGYVIDMQKLKLEMKAPYILVSMMSLSAIFYGICHSRYGMLSFIGKNSIYFYMSQGVGASVIYHFYQLLSMKWWVKLPIMFSLNITITLALSLIMIKSNSVFKSLISKVLLRVNGGL